jgi:recombination protein RecA
MAAVALDLDAATLERFGILHGTEAMLPERAVLSLGWPELEKVLPDHGFPRGVIELASPPSKAFFGAGTGAGGTKRGAFRGGATTLALAAVQSVHAADDRSWCAWITPHDAPSLYAPALVQAGIDLSRLLVCRPKPSELARTAIKVATSGAFDLVVTDAQGGLDGRLAPQQREMGGRSKVESAVVVRKLALASEEKGTTCLVLTNAYESRATPWPVALRVEVERRPDALAVRVTKDRRGRASSQYVVRLAS